MFSTHRHVFSLLAITLAASTFTAQAAEAVPNASSYGAVADARQVARQIDIQADTRYVNVTDGETVRFVVGERSFVWRFATLVGETSLNLADIAPKELQLPAVRVYVASNPIYRG